jgi:hypothetical protein
MKKFFNFKIVWFTLPLLVVFRAAGTDLYDTYPNYNGGSFIVTNGEELGNQLFFNNTFTITNLNFEYYTPDATFSGGVGIDLRFYANDGQTNANGYATPGTLLFDSGVFNDGSSLPANGPGLSGFNTVSYDVSDFGSSRLMPSNFTFTVTFSGLSGSDQIEDPLANPTNMFGESFGDYWLTNSGSGQWELLTNAVPASLVVQIGGTPTPTPEPSVVYLGAVGGGALMLLLGLRKSARAGRSRRSNCPVEMLQGRSAHPEVCVKELAVVQRVGLKPVPIQKIG